MSRKKFSFPTYHPPYDLPYAEYTPAASPHFYTKRKRGKGNPMDPYYRQPVVNLSGAQLRHSQYVYEDPYDFVAVNKPIDFYLAPGSANLHDDDDDLLEFYLLGADEEEEEEVPATKPGRWGKITSFFKDIKLPKFKRKKKISAEGKAAIIAKRKGKILGWLGVKKLKRLLRKAKKGDPEAKAELRAISKKARGRKKRRPIVFPDSGKVWTALDPKWKNKKGERVQYTWDKKAKTIKYLSPRSGRIMVLKSTSKSYKSLLKNKALKWKILVPERGQLLSPTRKAKGHEFLGKLAASAQATDNAPEPVPFSNKFAQLAENSKLKIIQAMEQGANLPLVIHGEKQEALEAQQELTERAKESEQTNEKLAAQKKKSNTLLYATVGTGLVSLGVVSYLIINRKKGEHNATQ